MKYTPILILYLLASCMPQNKTSPIITYPGGFQKALILSYDDGTIQDVELASLFDEHKLIGTFNLNSGYIGTIKGWPLANGDTVYQRYVPTDSLDLIYKNHEIAAHGQYHKDFTTVSIDEVRKELAEDISYFQDKNIDVKSMAYPFGKTDTIIGELARELGFINGRTIDDTHTYSIPDSDQFLFWPPTTHDSRVLEHSEKYINLKSDDLKLLYVWGHSWEFGDSTRWNNMIKFCEAMGKAEDIWSVGHREFTEYILAIRDLEWDINEVRNPNSRITIWIKHGNQTMKLKPGQTREF